MRISVVTPWFNCHDLLPDYERVIELGHPDQVIVVDNGSDPPLVREGWRLFRFTKNRGFAHACNLGLAHASADAVLFLNNDVRAVSETDWLQPIRALLGPGRLVGAQLRSEPHAAIDGRPLAYLDGWCLAGMRDDLLELGGWDESYEEPSYYGDNDLSLRAKSAGFKLIQAPVPLVHLNSTTTRRIGMAAVGEVTARNRERYLERARELLAC